MTKTDALAAESESPSQRDDGFYSIIDYAVDGVETQRRLISAFVEIQERWVRFHPGYRSARFFASFDGRRVYNVVHWDSEEAFRQFEKTSDNAGRWAALEAALAALPGAEPRMNGAPRFKMVQEVAPGPQRVDTEPRPQPADEIRTIEVYVDFTCPWCFIAKRRIDAALSQLADRSRVRVVWRSYELSPNEGRVPGATAEELIRTWRGDEADARIARVRALGVADGLALNLDRARPVSTFDAHRLMHLAAARGRAEDVVERIFLAYHTEGRNLADPAVLVAIGAEAGLDRADVERVLASALHADEVREDERRAAAQAITSVPAIVISGESPLPGLQSTSDLTRIFSAPSPHRSA
ncbi:2-hydroxychromene-2-carboxylate isomerase/DsbA-like thioredoxin domain protein [Minicystis rosea]|nr:2-hydroxychromene-2-carboxylate isomerase/DsbA-like thioredoxin domain protein [Minicystis rosea]